MLRGDLYLPWFVEDGKWGFEIISGEFLGVVVQIHNIDFAEEGNNVVVEHHVIHKPEILTEDDINGELFQQVYETIINDILAEAIEIHKNG